MGDKERPDELASRSGGRRAGNEVKKAIQAEDEKDESKKETSDDSNNFHVSFVCLIYSILTSIQSMSRYKLGMRRKRTTPRQDSSGVHLWLVFMKAFQALLPHA